MDTPFIDVGLPGLSAAACEGRPRARVRTSTQTTLYGWLQVFQSEERAGKSSVTLVEDDFQDRLEELNRLKIKTLSVFQGDKVKVCIIHDPDGNQIFFAQGFDPDHRAAM